MAKSTKPSIPISVLNGNIKQMDQELKEMSSRPRKNVKLNFQALKKGDRIEIIELHHCFVRMVQPLHTNFFLQMIKYVHFKFISLEFHNLTEYFFTATQ